MTTLDDIPPFDPPLAELILPRTPRRHRHSWEPMAYERWQALGLESSAQAYECRCGQRKDEASSKRGRTSLRAGKDAERAIAKAYGGERVGQFGAITDVQTALFSIQSKAGGWFSERYYAELVKLPRTGGRIPTLVVSDRPGPGIKTRRLVIRLWQDDLDLHGG